MVKSKRTPVYKKSWYNLTSRQKLFREKSLDILSESRKTTNSLSKIARDHGISIKTVITNTNAFKKLNNRWIPKKYDKISRVMKINEDGDEKSIETSDSRNASVIGRYQNAIKQFLNNGNTSLMAEFKNKIIKDTKKVKHSFETNPQKIIELEQRKEEPEFYEIYEVEN